MNTDEDIFQSFQSISSYRQVEQFVEDFSVLVQYSFRFSFSEIRLITLILMNFSY